MRELCNSVDKSHPVRDRFAQKKNSAARVCSHSYWPPSLERRKAFLRIINAVEDAGSLNLINRTLVHTIDGVRAYTKYVCRRNFTRMRYTRENLICVFAELKLIGRSRIYSITSFFGRIKFSETRALHLDIQYRRFSTLFLYFI